MTFSLIAMDREHRYIVVAAATKTEAVGASVPAILPGIGGVVSQAFTNPELRQLALQELAKGSGANAALESALAQDLNPELRQLAVMDADGVSAVHTGDRCSEVAGESVQKDFLCVGNLLRNDRVIPAMAKAWLPAANVDELASRVLDCMDAAEAAGGDARGKQSAAMMIAEMVPEPKILREFRIDDHSEPLLALRDEVTEWLSAKAPLV